MLGSVVLDVAIGMVFVFLLLSLIASTLHEFLATVVQARSANLFRGLLSLFSAGMFDDGASFVEKIYVHGLVQGLYRDPSDYDFVGAPRGVTAKESKWRPTWVRRALEWLMRVEAVQPTAWLKNPDLLPAYIPSRVFAMALIDMLNVPAADGQKPIGKEALANVRSFLGRKLAADKGNKAIEALLALSVDAGDNLGKLQTNIENWYSDAMDRVSGWYKKNTQYVLLGIGLLLAVSFNVNAIAVGEALWFDRDVRQSMVDAASKMNEQARIASPNQVVEEKELAGRLSDDVGAFRTATASLLPLGWSHTPSLRLKGQTGESTQRRLLHLTSIAAGWLITGIAISLGAPFWFDLLNRFMVVRNTVKPQEKSQVEASKDPTPESKP